MSTIVSSFADIAKAVGDLLVSLFSSISTVFYTPASGDTAGSLTFIGVMAIVVLCVGLAILVLNWVRELISRR